MVWRGLAILELMSSGHRGARVAQAGATLELFQQGALPFGSRLIAAWGCQVSFLLAHKGYLTAMENVRITR